MPPSRALTSVWIALLLWLTSATATRSVSTTAAGSVRAWPDHVAEVGRPEGRQLETARAGGYLPVARHAPPAAEGLAGAALALDLRAHAGDRRAPRSRPLLPRPRRLAFSYDATAPPGSPL